LDRYLLRIPHPIQNHRIADHNRRTTCDIRGYCGPFINEGYYNDFPDPMWKGTGECVVCCNTCNVAGEREKERAATARVQAPAPARDDAASPDKMLYRLAAVVPTC
jgi:hypothetical protein